jgi:hypothetical protein
VSNNTTESCPVLINRLDLRPQTEELQAPDRSMESRQSRSKTSRTLFEPQPVPEIYHRVGALQGLNVSPVSKLQICQPVARNVYGHEPTQESNIVQPWPEPFKYHQLLTKQRQWGNSILIRLCLKCTLLWHRVVIRLSATS